MNVEVVDGLPRGGSGGGATLVVMLVLALLLGALAWWYVRRDDYDKPPPKVGSGLDPELTLEVSDVTASTVTVDWTFVGNDATYGAYSLTISANDSTIATKTPSSGSSSHKFSDLDSNRLYTIVMTVATDLGSVQATTTATTFPYPPQIIQTLAGTTSVRLDWFHPESGDFGYTVSHRRTDVSDPEWSTSIVLAPQTVVVEVTGLLSNTTYEFKITATSSPRGHAADSDIVEDTTEPVWPSCELHVTSVNDCSPTFENCRVIQCSKTVSNEPSAGEYFIRFTACKPLDVDDCTQQRVLAWPASDGPLTVIFEEAFTNYIYVWCQILYEVQSIGLRSVGDAVVLQTQAQPSQSVSAGDEIHITHQTAIIEWTLDAGSTGPMYLIDQNGVTCNLSDGQDTHLTEGQVSSDGRKAQCIHVGSGELRWLSPETPYTMRAEIVLTNNQKFDVEHQFQTLLAPTLTPTPNAPASEDATSEAEPPCGLQAAVVNVPHVRGTVIRVDLGCRHGSDITKIELQLSPVDDGIGNWISETVSVDSLRHNDTSLELKEEFFDYVFWSSRLTAGWYNFLATVTFGTEPLTTNTATLNDIEVTIV
jgi:hypothetical protein